MARRSKARSSHRTEYQSDNFSICRSAGADTRVDLLSVNGSAELRFLREEACDAIQGYPLARPGLISTLTELTTGKAAPAVSGTRKRALRIVQRGAA